MDLRTEVKDKFDAFQGNPLAKPVSQRRVGYSSNRSISTGGGSGVSGGNRKGSTLKIPERYNFDMMWKGSVSNLMSSENITEDLIKESIKELELAMQESKRMLVNRDEEITRLREFIDNNKLAEASGCDHKNCSETSQQSILQQLEKSESRGSLLERQLHDMRLTHSKEIAHLKNEIKAPPIWRIEDAGSSSPECTCYCGAVCKALHDLVETRKALETTKSKYDHLKKRVKEFRRQTGLDQRNKNDFGNASGRNDGGLIGRNDGGLFGRNDGGLFGRSDERSACSIQ